MQVIQGAAVATIVLNGVALWKQENRGSGAHGRGAAARAEFPQNPGTASPRADHAIRRLIAFGLGTMAFSMEDVLLEPYGGQILQLAVGDTTKLTAALAVGGLFGFWLASRVLSRRRRPVPDGEFRCVGGHSRPFAW